MVHSQLSLSPHFALGNGASGETDDSVLIPRQYILTVTDELLARWVNLESERPCGQDNERVKRNKRWQQYINVSKSSAQEKCDTYNSTFLLQHCLAHGGAAPGCSTNDLQQRALIHP